MEMDESEVDNYLQFFNIKTKYNGYFFCSNRLRKRHYFFNYKFNFLKDFKLIFLEKDKIFIKINHLLQCLISCSLKKDKSVKDIKFNILHKLTVYFILNLMSSFIGLLKI